MLYGVARKFPYCVIDKRVGDDGFFRPHFTLLFILAGWFNGMSNSLLFVRICVKIVMLLSSTGGEGT